MYSVDVPDVSGSFLTSIALMLVVMVPAVVQILMVAVIFPSIDFGLPLLTLS